MIVELQGFVDIQVNGFAAVDFNEPGVPAERLRSALRSMRATGVTRCLPTLITAPLDRFSHCARAIVDLEDPAVAGIHLEGPYISPEDGARGAHPREHTSPASIEDFERRQDAAGGRIVLVTLAPEVPGALPLVEHLVAAGIRVAIGHTAATPEVIRDAVTSGATLSTHLGNGCAAMLPRHPNVIWEQLADDHLWASLIVDGHHLPASTVKVFARVKSPARTILVTDAIAAAGCPPGRHRLGNIEVILHPDGRVSLPGTPLLAGSAVTMPEAIGNTVRFTGLALPEVAAMASAVPAGYLGISPAGTVTADWEPDTCRLTVRAVSNV
jgi:N-acetylglucosamine-6-phosphate deacetylase